MEGSREEEQPPRRPPSVAMGWPHGLRSQHPHSHPRQPDHQSPWSIGDWSLRLWATGFGLYGGVGMGGEVQLGRRHGHGGGRVSLVHSLSLSLVSLLLRLLWSVMLRDSDMGAGFCWLRWDQIYGDLTISPGISLPLFQSLTRGVFLALWSSGFSPLERERARQRRFQRKGEAKKDLGMNLRERKKNSKREIWGWQPPHFADGEREGER